MSLFNMSSLRGFIPGLGKKGKTKGATASKSEQLKRHLALDSLEDRILLSITPNTSYDILVNQQYSQNQTTETSGNPVAIDDDGDIVAVWTRGENVYKFEAKDPWAIYEISMVDGEVVGSRIVDNVEDEEVEGVEKFYLMDGCVGFLQEDSKTGNLVLDRLFREKDFLDYSQYLGSEDEDYGKLTAYIDPNTGEQMVDYNIYARYFTDEVQRLIFDTKQLEDGKEMGSFQVSTGGQCVQKLTFSTALTGPATSPELSLTPTGKYAIAGEMEFSYGQKTASFYFKESTDIVDTYQNASRMQEALENIFGTGKVTVTPTSANEFTIAFDLPEDSKLQLLQVDMLEDSSSLPSATAEWIRYPETTGLVRFAYDADGNIDIAGTAALLEQAINDVQTNYAEGPSLGEGPVVESSIVRQAQTEVQVVPVYNLGEGLIGFDITYVNRSGKQDVPDLEVTKLYTKLVGTHREDILKEGIYKVVTLKQSSEEFRVNSMDDDQFDVETGKYTATAQTEASVTMDSDGDFAISWTSETLQIAVPGSFSDIYARTYTPKMFQYQVVTETGEIDAEPVEVKEGDIACVEATSQAFRVNTTVTGPQTRSSIAMDDQGNFVVIWQSGSQKESYANAIYMQRYDYNGNRVGSEIRVDTEATREMYDPQIAVSPDGKYVGVVWGAGNREGSVWDIYYKLYGYVTDDAGVTTFQQLDESYVTDGMFPSITFNQSNQFAIAVEVPSDMTDVPLNQTTNWTGVRMWEWEATENGANILRSNIRVNSSGSIGAQGIAYWAGNQNRPTIVMDADGDIVVSYDGAGMDVSENVVFTEEAWGKALAPYIANGANADIAGFLRGLIFAELPNTTIGTPSQFVITYGISSGDIYGTIRNILSAAEGENYDRSQLGRINGILEKILGQLHGEANGALFTMYDADHERYTDTLMSDAIANAKRDGYNASYYFELDRTTLWGSVTIEVTNDYGTNSTFFVPVYDANDNLDVQATASALKAALQSLPNVGTAWQVADDLEGPIEVRITDRIELEGDSWNNDNIDNMVIFEVVFQGTVHDMRVDFTPTAGVANVSQISSFTLPMRPSHYGTFGINNGGEVNADRIKPINWNGNLNATRQQLHAALVALGYDGASLRYNVIDATLENTNDGTLYTIDQNSIDYITDPDTGVPTLTSLNVTDEDGNSYQVRNLEDVYCEVDGAGNCTIDITTITTIEDNEGTPHTVRGQGPTIEVTFGGSLAGSAYNLTHVGTPLKDEEGNIISGWNATGPYVPPITIQMGRQDIYNSPGAMSFVCRTEAISYGYAGTWQGHTGIGIQPNGSFTNLWLQADTDSTGIEAATNIYFREFTETEDNAGPQVLDMIYKDGTHITQGTQLSDLTDGDLGAFIVVFSEKMMNPEMIADITDTATRLQYIQKAVTNSDNWVLMKDGEPVENAIDRIEFGMNRSADLDMSKIIDAPLMQNKWEAIVIFKDGINLEDGTYQLVAKNDMTDINQNPLGKTGIVVDGANAVYEFNVIVGNQPSENITPDPPYTNDQTFTTAGTNYVPTTVASDYEGDTVTVWKDSDTGYIMANIQYLKWDANGNERTDLPQKSNTIDIAGFVTDENWKPIDKDGNLIDKDDPDKYAKMIPVEVEYASVAMNGEGNFVVTWSQNNGTSTSPNWDIYVQVFDLNGNAISEAVKANTSTETTDVQQRYSNVAVSLTGEFVVTWQSYRQNGSANWDIYANRFAADGTALGLDGEGKEFLVNDSDTVRYDQQNAAIAMDNHGNFVITWTATGQGNDSAYETNIYAKRFTKQVISESTIVTSENEFLVNDEWEANNQQWASIAMDADGDFVISWTSHGQDGVGNGPGGSSNGLNGVFAQRYDTTGTKVGQMFQVNTTAENDQQRSKVAMDADGDFIIVWESFQEVGNGTGLGSADNWGIYAQRYVSNDKYVADTNNSQYGPYGVLGGEYRVHKEVAYDQMAPSVAVSHVGDIFVAWQDNRNGMWDIYRRDTYRPTDDTGSVVVKVEATTQNRTTVVVENGDTVETKVVYIDVTFGEQLFEDEGSIYSILNLNNWEITRDGVNIKNLVECIECIGYDKKDTSYPNETSQKDIYRIVLKTGETLGAGEYEITILDRVIDKFNNELDGDADGHSGGDFTINFTIEEVTQPLTGDEVLSSNDGTTEFPGNQIFTEDSTGWTPSATSSNAAGDIITVWQDISDDSNYQGLWYHLKNWNDQDAAVPVRFSQSKTAEFASVAMTSNGFVVTWMDNDAILAQIFTIQTDGSILGGTPIVVTSDGQYSQISAAENGSFVVAWQDGTSVYAQKYDADGTATGTRFSASGKHVSVSMNDNDKDKEKYVVSWTNNDEIYVSVNGGTEQVISNTLSGTNSWSNVAMDNEGDIVVTWTNVGEKAGMGYDVYICQSNADGTFSAPVAVANTNGAQQFSKVAVDNDGDFVVIWQSEVDDSQTGGTLNWDVLGQRFYKDGSRAGNVFTANETKDEEQRFANVTMLPEGNFAVTWQSNHRGDEGIYGGKFFFTGTVVSSGDEEKIPGTDDVNNITVTESGWTPVNSATDYEGDTVTVWTDGTKIYGKIDYIKWDNTGSRSAFLGGSRTIEIDTDKRVEFASVAMDDSGNFVVTWSQNDGTDLKPDWNIYASLYDLNGTVIRSPFLVNTTTYSQQQYSQVSMSTEGEFVIVWQSQNQEGRKTGWDIYGQRFDSQGNALGLDGRGREFLVNTTTAQDQVFGSVAMDSHGGFVVTWTGYGQDGDAANQTNIYARRFDRETSSFGDEFLVNADTVVTQTTVDDDGNTITTEISRANNRVGNQKWSSVAVDTLGNYVITWTGFGQEGDSVKASNGIFAKRYSLDGTNSDMFLVNTTIVNDQQRSRVAMDADGDFVIIWESFQEGQTATSALEEADNWGIYGQRFVSAAKLAENPDLYGENGQLEKEFRVNATIIGDQQYANVTMTHTGDYFVNWYSNNSGLEGMYQSRTLLKTDDAGPVVVRVEGNDKSVLIHNGDTIAEEISFIDITFGEQLLGQMADETDSLNSILNPNNWRITKDGKVLKAADVIASIVNVGYGSTGSENPQKDIFRVTFQKNLDAGEYVITLDERVSDRFENFLDGDLDGTPGGDWVFSFTIDPQMQEWPVGQVADPGYFADDDSWVPNATASDYEGDTVTVWTNENGGISARIDYVKWDTSNGRTPLDEGSYKQLVVTDESSAHFASVAMDASGNFVVTWTQNDGTDLKPDWNIHAAVYDLNGDPIREDFLVNTTTADTQCYSQVAMDKDGDFVIVWQSYDETEAGTDWNIRGQRYNADGTEFGVVDEVQSLNFYNNWQGTFTLTFEEKTTAEIEFVGNPSACATIIQKELDKLATELNNAYKFTVNAGNLSQILITIESNTGNRDVSQISVQVVKDTSSNAKSEVRAGKVIDGTSGEFMVNETIALNQVFPTIAMDQDGNFVVSWTGDSQEDANKAEKDRSTDIYARLFYSNSFVDTSKSYDKILGSQDPDYYVTEDKTGVGLVQTNLGSGTGSLLTTGRHVLTAAHVVTDEAGNPVSTVVVTFNTPEGQISVAGRALIIHQDWTGSGTLGDLAIIELEENLTGRVETYDINRDGSLDVGSVFTRYGYGLYGTGEEGVEAWDGQKRTGQNKWEALGSDLMGHGYQVTAPGDNILVFDFDDGTEANDTLGRVLGIHDLGLGIWETNSTSGDSGGPCFVNNIIFGVCQGGYSQTCAYGDISIDTRVSYYADWIDSVISTTAISSEFIVNSDSLEGNQKWSSVAMDADGDFVVTWTSDAEEVVGEEPTNGIYAKRYDASGEAVGESFLVNSTTYNDQQFSKVAMDVDGDFVVVWESFQERRDGTSSFNAQTWGVYGQRYVRNDQLSETDTVGAIGEQFRIAEDWTTNQRFANVAMTHTGDFIVTWQDYQVDDKGNWTEHKIDTRMYSKYTDDTGSVLVRVADSLDAKKGTILTEGLTLEKSDVENLTELYFTFGEQMDESNSLNSILKKSNWSIRRDGVTLSDAIKDIISVGYANENDEYPFDYADGESIQKHIFKVTFQEGTFAMGGTYTITVAGNVVDLSGNPMEDGNAALSFTVEDSEEIYEPITDADGTDTLINGNTAGSQTEPSIAMDADGNYVVVWVTDGSVVNGVATKNVVGQKFDRFGNKVGSEFYVSDFLEGVQNDPQIAMDQYGNFVVTWTVSGLDKNNDGVVNDQEMNEQDVYVRVFDRNCAAAGDSFLAATTTAGKQKESSVAISDDGTQFVVTWTNVDSNSTLNDVYGIYAQRFSFLGNRIGNTFLVHSADTYEQSNSNVAMDASGNIVVTWQSSHNNTTGQDIFMRKFNANNQAVSSQTVVNTVTAAKQEKPVITMNDIGQFIIAWQSQINGSDEIRFQCFNSNLNRLGGETQANVYTRDGQITPSVAMTRDSANGTAFTISWASYGQEGPQENHATNLYGIYARMYNSITTRTSDTNEIRMNAYTMMNEITPSIAMDAYGNAAVVWTGPEQAATGGNTTSSTDTNIYGRNWLVREVPNYVAPTGGTGRGNTVVSESYQQSYNKNYASLVNGGGTVSSSSNQVTITGAENAANRLIFNSASDVLLNGAKLSETGKNYVYNATENTQNTVIITGQGNETVTVSGNTVIVKGTNYSLTINGASEVLFNGTGTASVTMNAGEGDLFTASGTSASLVTGGMTVQVNGCHAITANATGKQSTAQLATTAGVDNLNVAADKATLTGSGYSVTLNGFANIAATGSAEDTVVWNVASGTFAADGNQLTWNDSFSSAGFGTVTVQGLAEMNLSESSLTLTGTGDVTASAEEITFAGRTFVGFANATITGTGTATLLDSVGNDTLVVDGSGATLSGTNYSIITLGFANFDISSQNGGNDTARITGSEFTVNGGKVTFGDSTVEGFSNVEIESENGTLNLTGTEGADRFVLKAGEISAKLGVADYSLLGFANVTLDGAGGKDQLFAYDSAGDDVFEMTPGSLTWTAQGLSCQVSQVQTIQLYRTSGGNDTLKITDTDGKDTAAVRSQWATMVSDRGNSVTATGFANMTIESRGGEDTVILYDSKGNDTLTVKQEEILFSGNSFYNQVSGFRKAYAYSLFGGKDSVIYDEIFTEKGEVDGMRQLRGNDVEVNFLAFNEFVERAFSEK
ncbi:MAG: hypothetical protein Q4D62_08715 [Planctomycetia bacterium]|nr:hypothetical protein [Planctomycetia bacterium]